MREKRRESTKDKKKRAEKQNNRGARIWVETDRQQNVRQSAKRAGTRDFFLQIAKVNDRK